MLVRRQAIATLNRLQSVLNIQSQVRAKRSQMLDGSSCSQGNKKVMHFKGKDIKVHLNKMDTFNVTLYGRDITCQYYFLSIIIV